MHASLRVCVSLVSAPEVVDVSTSLKEGLGLKIRNVVSNTLGIDLGEVAFEWREPFIYSAEAAIVVTVHIYPSRTFDLNRNQVVDLMGVVLQVLREAQRDVFSERTQIILSAEERRDVLFAASWGPSKRLPPKPVT
ncbi:MAG: hypothetical protein U9M98_02925 [Patescibacteria group bacterium]|nr:hypothetical protein [Patescibacteria group bacterium]